MKVLFATPPLETENAGGIQAAGRIAWDAIRSQHNAQLLEADAQQRWRAVKTTRADRFNADVVLFWHLDLLRLAVLLRGRPRRAVFLHGIEAWRRRDPLTRRLLQRTSLISNSRYTLERAQPYLPTDAVQHAQVVPLGLGSAARETTPPDVIPMAIMIGRLDAAEAYKGHRETISAWPLVLEKVPAAQLFVIGVGDLRASLEAHAAALGLTNAVRFIGRAAEAEKEALLRAARCLVLPSRGEGFGLVYLEAMRLGRPCIVGADAGREVVDVPAAGIAVDPSNPRSIADAVVCLLTDDAKTAQLGEAARVRYQENFTAGHFQARLLAALEHVR